MITDKLIEALEQVHADRKFHQNALHELDQTENQLKAMVAKHSGVAWSLLAKKPQETSIDNFQVVNASQISRDGLDDVVDILRSAGKALHITVIADRLSEIRGTKIERTAIEPGMNRHIQKTKKRRIEKFAPSTFGLPEWKQEQPSLAHIA